MQEKIDNNTISSIDMKIVDKIDKILTIGSIHAVKTLKGALHTIPWSIKLNHRIITLLYQSHIKRRDELNKELPSTYDKS